MNNPFKDAVASVASTTACKISRHRWLGCKCTRCDETQDSPGSYHDENYHNVVDELEKAGFTNIKLIGLGDLVIAFEKTETEEEIQITTEEVVVN